MGAAIAIALAGAGAQIACHGNSRSPEGTCEQINSADAVAHPITDDLAHTATAKLLVEQKLERFGRLDTLINNAGTIRRAPTVEYSEDDWATVIEVNLSSVFRLSRLAGKHMIESSRGGKIVNIASLLSFQGGITVPAYAVSKGGVAQLTKALANDWARHGINVNAIAPGYRRATNTAALQADEVRNRQILERIYEHLPLDTFSHLLHRNRRPIQMLRDTENGAIPIRVVVYGTAGHFWPSTFCH